MKNKKIFNDTFFDTALSASVINKKSFTINFFTTDSRVKENASSTCFIAIKGENHDGNDFFQNAYQNGVRVFILNKLPSEIPSDAIIYHLDDSIQALALLAKHYRQELTFPHILITGSVGKTTTRLLITHMLRQQFHTHTAQKNWNNHLGLPLTILATDTDTEFSVLEAGMSAFGEISYLSNIVQPNISIITSIGQSHAEFVGGQDNIAQCKIEIVDGMDDQSILLINQQDPYKELFISRAKGRVEFFNPEDISITNDLGIYGFEFIYKQNTQHVFRCPIPGHHLTLNLSILMKCAELLNVSWDSVARGLECSNKGLDNRMRVFRNGKGVHVIADCYNASEESFKAALDVLKISPGKRIAVIGDVLELGNHSISVHKSIGQYITQSNSADLILAIGKDISFTCQELSGIPYCHFNSKEEILSVLNQELHENDTVLIKASNGIGLSIIVQALENNY